MLYVEAEKGGGEFAELNSQKSPESESDGIVKNSSSGGESSELGGDSKIPLLELGGRGKRVREKELEPVEQEVEEVSYQHAGHAGVRGSDGETHFNVRVVSIEFAGKSLVKRQTYLWPATRAVGCWTAHD